MMSTEHARALVSAADHQKARLVMIGDRQQLSAIEPHLGGTVDGELAPVSLQLRQRRREGLESDGAHCLPDDRDVVSRLQGSQGRQRFDPVGTNHRAISDNALGEFAFYTAAVLTPRNYRSAVCEGIHRNA